MSQPMKTIEAFARLLEASGHETIFGYPGESTLPFYAAIKENTEIRHVMARCEKGAGYMADAYARVKNVLGFVDSPVGIGTPLLTPFLNESFNSSIPVFVFTSAISFSKIERWPTSHIEHPDMFKPFVKKTFRLEKSNRLQDAYSYLVRLSLSGRPAPVHLEMPLETMESEYREENQNLPPEITCPQFPPALSIDDARTVTQTVENADFPMVIAGGGIHLSHAYSELREFVETNGIPVATTLNGKGAIEESHPLALGVIGSKGTKFANKLVEQADLVLVFGSKLGDKTTNAYTLFSRKQKIIRIDTSPEELARFDYTAFGYAADCRLALRQINSMMKKRRLRGDRPQVKKQLQEYLSEYDSGGLRVSPRAILKAINEHYPENAIMAADASVACGWAGVFFQAKKPGRSFIAPRGTGSIGYALPSMVGCKEAKPENKVIGFGGDSGFLMSMHEMETVRRLNHDSTFVLLNDNDVGLLTKFFREVFGKKKQILPTFNAPNYEKIGNGFHWETVTIERNSEIPDAIKQAIKSDGPLLLNAQINTNIYAPDFENTLIRKSLKK